MITLEDTQNRNYYFYNGTQDVRVDFVKEIFRTFLGYDYAPFIAEKMKNLLEKGYSESEAKQKAEHQAVETCMFACKSIPKYRKEIKDYFVKNPSRRGGITDEQIGKMRFVDLKTLRINLGLSKRGKKVTKVEPAPEQTTKKARNLLESKPTQAVVTSIYIGGIDEIRRDAMSESSYTLEELRQILGYDITYEEAVKQGYHVDDAPSYQKVEEPVEPEPKKTLPPARTPSREELIAAINEELLEMPREVAENVYWYIQDKKLHGFGRSK